MFVPLQSIANRIRLRSSQCDPTSKPDLETSRAHLKVSLAGVGLVAAVPPEVLAVTGELHSGHAASADLGA